jgi:hypothetical protein
MSQSSRVQAQDLVRQCVSVDGITFCSVVVISKSNYSVVVISKSNYTVVAMSFVRHLLLRWTFQPFCDLAVQSSYVCYIGNHRNLQDVIILVGYTFQNVDWHGI